MQFVDLKKQYLRIEEGVLQAISTVLEHGQYIMGPEITELERQLADFVDVKHAIVNSSGTDALLMALMALDIGPGDEVITTPFSFFATAEVILLAGAKPVFVDIEPDTWNLDAARIERAITPKTRAIMPVSLYGQCADMESINALARAHNIAVIEDAAQSFGAQYQGRFSCGISDIGCTSFFPSKPLGGYGDSGACFTNDDTLAETLRQIRNHGQKERYKHERLGMNGRMDTLQAAILLEKLKLFPEEIELRAAVAARYDRLLDNCAKVAVTKAGRTNVYAQYTLEVNDRAAFQKALADKGIPTAVHYPIAMHLQPALKNLGYKPGDFPVAERASARVVSLPMHPYLTLEEQERVAGVVREALNVQFALENE